MLKNKDSLSPLSLHCFSPPVMLATFFIELGLVAWALWRYKLTPIVKIIVTILVLLATFQYAEYNVCEGSMGLDSLTWSRIGYVVITFLPVLGIHGLFILANRRHTVMTTVLYVAAVMFAGYFLTVGQGLTSSVCNGNYVIFEVNPAANTLYMLYYYGLELITLLLGMRLARTFKNKRTKRALYGLVFGYLCLLVPTTTVNLVNPETIRGIPSIMCGFAIFLALALVFIVLPPVAKKREAT